MKNAAKCDTSCDLQNPVNHQNFERILRFRDMPGSMLVGVSVNTTRPPTVFIDGGEADYACSGARAPSAPNLLNAFDLYCLAAFAARTPELLTARCLRAMRLSTRRCGRRGLDAEVKSSGREKRRPNFLSDLRSSKSTR